MLRNEDLELLYSNPKGRMLHKVKWILIGLVLLAVIASIIFLIKYESLSIEEQLNSVIWGHNALTIGCIISSVCISIIITSYIIIERECVKLVMYLRHKELTNRLENCLKIDKSK